MCDLMGSSYGFALAAGLLRLRTEAGCVELDRRAVPLCRASSSADRQPWLQESRALMISWYIWHVDICHTSR